MIKIYVWVAILYINLSENDADNITVPSRATIPKLEFWTRDPKFNDRKFFENRRQMPDDDKENKIYYRRGRVNSNSRLWVLNTSQKYRQRSNRGRQTKDHFDRGSRGRLQPPSLRSGDDEKDVWPRAKRMRHRSHNTGNDDTHSTRMTPMYLMQQPNEGGPAVPTTQRSTTEEVTQPNLSPYSLERQVRQILSKYNEVNASIEVLGRTVEYNDILLVKLSEQKNEIGKYFRAEESKYIEEVPEKKIVFIVHALSVMGIHGLATLSNNKYFSKLLSYYIKHLNMFDIFLMPLANPDGYAAEATEDFWNKNVSPQSACVGVALDRNFDVAWNTAKVYSSCSQLYPGPTPFSEPETRAVRDVLHKYGHKIVAYIHVHAGTPTADVFKGEAVLYPKGFTEVQSDDDKYVDLRGEIDEAMRNASFQVMSVTVDTLHNWYGKVYGSSVDYASTIYGIPYALEFVMQIYRENEWADKLDEMEDYNALTVIWSRIIHVVFNNINRNIHANEVQ